MVLGRAVGGVTARCRSAGSSEECHSAHSGGGFDVSSPGKRATALVRHSNSGFPSFVLHDSVVVFPSVSVVPTHTTGRPVSDASPTPYRRSGQVGDRESQFFFDEGEVASEIKGENRMQLSRRLLPKVVPEPCGTREEKCESLEFVAFRVIVGLLRESMLEPSGSALSGGGEGDSRRPRANPGLGGRARGLH